MKFNKVLAHIKQNSLNSDEDPNIIANEEFERGQYIRNIKLCHTEEITEKGSCTLKENIVDTSIVKKIDKLSITNEDTLSYNSNDRRERISFRNFYSSTRRNEYHCIRHSRRKGKIKQDNESQSFLNESPCRNLERLQRQT